MGWEGPGVAVERDGLAEHGGDDANAVCVEDLQDDVVGLHLAPGGEARPYNHRKLCEAPRRSIRSPLSETMRLSAAVPIPASES